MKWSEFFAGLLGDKDTDVSVPSLDVSGIQSNQNVSIQDNSNGEQLHLSNKQDIPSGQSTTVLNTVTNQSTNDQNQEFTKQQFDALNARIKQLEDANKALLLQGSADTVQPKTDEEILYSLCVGGRNHGKESDSNQRTSAAGN